MQFAQVKLSTLAIAAGLMVVAGAASAQTVTSGGASLPAKMYQAIITASPAQVQGSWTYTSVSSGAGKSAFLTNSVTPLIAGATGPVQIVGSDSALSQTELDNYNATYNPNNGTTGYGRLIQIPAVATPVLLPYKEANISALNLSTEQICKIFSFDTSARTWNQVTGGVAAVNAIKVTYRGEAAGSGTTELLSRFLKAACTPYLPAGKSFTISNVFKTVVASALPSSIGATNADGLPAAWVSVSGSGGMSTGVAQADALGYLSPDPVYTGDDNSVVAKINGYLPTAASIQSALPAPPTGLARNNPLNWVPAYALPTAAYPIYGTTNLLVGQCYATGVGAGTPGGAVKDFVTKLNNGTYDSFISTHKFVKLPAAWNSAIASFFLTSGGSFELGGTSVCNGIGRS